MIWFSKDKKSAGKKPPAAVPASSSPPAVPSSPAAKGGVQGDVTSAVSPDVTARASRAELLAQAHENARSARAHIGEETLDRLAAAMRKKQEAESERAKSQIKSLDKEKVADHIKFWLDEKK